MSTPQHFLLNNYCKSKELCQAGINDFDQGVQDLQKDHDKAEEDMKKTEKESGKDIDTTVLEYLSDTED